MWVRQVLCLATAASGMALAGEVYVLLLGFGCSPYLDGVLLLFLRCWLLATLGVRAL